MYWLLISAIICLLIVSTIQGHAVLTAIAVAFLAIVLMGRNVQMYKSFPDQKLKDLQDKIARVIPEAADVTMVGGIQSFTINKKHVYICLKDKQNQYYSDNMLIYVILHELAHVLTPTISLNDEHTKEWEDMFNHLLLRAQKAGLYDPSQPIVSNYCEL